MAAFGSLRVIHSPLILLPGGQVCASLRHTLNSDYRMKYLLAKGNSRQIEANLRIPDQANQTKQ
jgi:hypothetical protein